MTAEEARKKDAVSSSPRNAVYVGNGISTVSSTGSARHDFGFATDGYLLDNNGEKVKIAHGSAEVQTFIRACREKGLHSVGLGFKYMDGYAIHLDIAIGNSKHGSVASVFSAKGRSDIPQWCRDLMKNTRTALNSPSGTTVNGQSYKTSSSY